MDILPTAAFQEIWDKLQINGDYNNVDLLINVI
jgi:hypothetical protein